MNDAGRFLGEVIRSSEISAEKPHFPFNVARQQRMAILIHELAVHTYGRRSGDRRHLTRHFAAFLEASNRAVQDDEIGRIR